MGRGLPCPILESLKNRVVQEEEVVMGAAQDSTLGHVEVPL